MKFIYIISIICLIIYFINSKNKRKNILVMFSGGLDSTTSLYKLLKKTDYNIYVHHIILKDNSNRWKNELISCNKIINELKKIRNFEYSESMVDINLFSNDKLGGSRQDDLIIIAFIASMICGVESYKKIDSLVISELKYELTNSKNLINNMINTINVFKWSSIKEKLYDPLENFYKLTNCKVNQKNIKNLEKMLESFKTEETKSELKNIKSKLNKIICIKRQMYNFLPKNIKKHITFCRNPINNKNCNKCFNCLMYKEII